MKILRILNRLIIGGPLLNAAYLSKYMDPEFETLLVVGQKEDHEKDAGFLTGELGIHPLYLPEMGRSINPLRDLKAYRKLKKIIADFKPDIVHTHAAKPGALGRLAASAMGVPVIVHTYHGHVFHSYFGKWKTGLIIRAERYLATRSTGIVAISELQRDELVNTFRIAPAEKMRVIPLGLDLNRFRDNQPAKRKQFRDAYNLQEDEVVISIIGRLVPVKNHALFLQGISHVLKNSSKKIRAFIVGDGETRQALEEQARQLGIPFSTEKSSSHPHPLVFTSWRQDIDVINAGSDIIALSSFNEGTPVSLIEAQAAGRPIVSTRVGGIGDIIREGETALLSEVHDTAGFCNNLLRLVEDDALRMEMGGKGTAHVMEKFSYQRLVNDMADYYRELAGKR